MGATAGFNKTYKRELARCGKIHCSRCPYHRRENVTGRGQRTDYYKTKRKKNV